MQTEMIEVHAIADGWERAAEWRAGRAAVSSWKVRDVSSGTQVGTVTAGASGFRLEVSGAFAGLHVSLRTALAVAVAALSPASRVLH